MNLFKGQKCFDFLYGNTPFSKLDYERTYIENDNIFTTIYSFADGLKITNIITKYDDAYECVNWFENVSDNPTKIISELYDGYITLPLAHEEPLEWTTIRPAFDDITTVYAPTGSTCNFKDFCTYASQIKDSQFLGHIPPGESKQYATSGGRSSEQSAPFFNIHKNGKGYIFAIGWTGQWNCSISRTKDNITIKSKIEDTHFKIFPHEKFRTSSFVLMPYEGSVIQSHNKWRKLIKEHFSLIGRDGRDGHGPLCAGIWGGMKTSSVLERIEAIRKNKLPIEYIWMDAGWYGEDTKPSPDEFEGDWVKHTGDWRVSPFIHSNDLKDVSDATHHAGMKFLLWFEPERVHRNAPIVIHHPEYFIFPENVENENLLLNLGNTDAWNYCFYTISHLIEDIGIDCYRQDFNMQPLSYWRKNDAEDRKGISEIKHINGLYHLWDALLARFPYLIIDNCASGGRRIDIETLRRSIPLWRSDFQSPSNYLSDGAQYHNLTFNLWMPFSGTGSGRLYDTYRIRSAYSPAFMVNYTFSERDNFGDDSGKMEWLKRHLNEYLKVRPYMSEDFYPLTEASDCKDVWCVAQFDRPSENDGVIQIFRRENSSYEKASFMLGAIDKNYNYIFTDADTGSESTFGGVKLAENGFTVQLKEKRSSKIYFYKKVESYS